MQHTLSKLSKWSYRPALAAIGLSLGLATAASAQTYPAQPVQVVIPFSAGGPTDIIGRELAKALSEELKQQFVVENKTGASGTIATSYVARAKPNGYTVLFHEVAATFGIQPRVMPSLPYDVAQDFTPVGLAARGPIFLLVNDALPVTNLKELIALAKQKPGMLTFGSAGGSGQLPTHIGPELFKVKQGLDILHVPYKGTGPALIDLAAGRLSFMMTTGTGSAKAFLDAGKIRAIAVTGKTRSERMPDVATFLEQGVPIPELNDGTAWGLFGPAGLPDDVVAKLNAAMQKVLGSPELRASFARLDIYPAKSTAKELGALMRTESSTWKPLVAKMNIKAG
jgi:tripartite-type tricarboxylate transporter receptor subunit TctC